MAWIMIASALGLMTSFLVGACRVAGDADDHDEALARRLGLIP